MSGRNILVVEDDNIIAADIQYTLKRLGYDVLSTAVSGEEAIKKAALLKPDLVLMDIVLKGAIDGIKAAAHIINQFNIPVVYLTSHSDRATIERARETGPYGYLMKPFDEKDMSATLEMALYKHGMEKRLKENEQWLSIILKSIADAVIVTDATGGVGFMNPAAEALTGWSFDEAVGKGLADVFQPADSETGRPLENPASAVLKTREPQSWQNAGAVLQTRGGASLPVEHNASPIRNDKGETTGAVIVFRDETERRRAVSMLENSERFLNTIFDSIRDPFCIFDRDLVIVRANKAYAELRERHLDEVYGKRCEDILCHGNEPCDECTVQKTVATGKGGTRERAVDQPDGSKFWIEIFTHPIFDEDGRVTHVIEHTRDITQRRRYDEERRRLILELEHLSRVDSLTELLNRRALMDFMSQELERSKRYGRDICVLLSDIDNFKDINDTYGHAVGDIALERVSKLMRDMIRKTDVVGRYGGDEFMIIMPETDLKGGVEFAERLCEAVREINISAGRKRVPLTLSIGASALHAKLDSIDSLITRADAALYESKREGRDRVSYIKS